MENGYHIATRGSRRSRAERPPVDRPSCGSVAGANRHYAEREMLCGGCEIAMKERTRVHNARTLGSGEFGKLPAYRWKLEEPLVEWRLLQTKELEDGPYNAGPWYTRIRVPKDLVNAPVKIGGAYTITFNNGQATYTIHHEDEHFVFMEIVRSSIRSWFDLIEEKYQ